jgi:metallo-beta-lactamase class B
MTPTLRFAAALLSTFAVATAAAGEPAQPCESCAVWNVSQKPFKLFGNSYYVGPHGLGSILITSDKGHVLIDGGLPESAPKIAANVHALGFKVEDIEVILNSHDHFDHAGGIAELQKLSGAKVWASAASAKVFETGEVEREDPQFGTLPTIPKIENIAVIKDRGVVKVGPLALTANFTPGHTAGGTTWTWKSCEGERCVNMVYADSISAASSPGYKFSAHPAVLAQFDKTFKVIESLPCDLLVNTHPELTGLWERLEKRDSQGNRDALIDSTACDMYVAGSRDRLRKRLAEESRN